MLDSEFLTKVAYAQQLSPDQEEVFLLRFAQNQDYDTIASQLNTSTGACLKRMGQVYKKFGISGGRRGKESQLRHLLLEKYEQVKPSTIGNARQQSLSRQISIVYREQEPDSGIASQLQQLLSSRGHRVILTPDKPTKAKNWSQLWQQQLQNCDCLLLLLSHQLVSSELLIEELESLQELQKSSPSNKPMVVAIRVNWEANTAVNYQLRNYLQTILQQEWRSPRDTATIVGNLLPLLQGETANIPPLQFPPVSSQETVDGQPLPVAAPELPEGQVALTSAFYIERPPIESRCYEQIQQPGSLIRIKAARQMGKTSLMARILQQAVQLGYPTVHINFQLADRDIFANLEFFLKWFCANVGHSLHIPNQLDEYWDEFLGSKVNCKAYFEQYLLPAIGKPVVIGLDEVDRIFPYGEIAEDFLGLLRAWHEEGKRRPIWKQLRLVVVHSTEVYIPMDINQSPFNVGLAIELPEFTPAQVTDLAHRYGLDWQTPEITPLMNLVGGHPYLVRLALYHIAQGDITLEQLLATAATETGLYSDHLRRHLWHLEKNPELLTAMQTVVTSQQPTRLSSEIAFKLDSMGLVRFHGNQVVPRYDLYRCYFQELLKDIVEA